MATAELIFKITPQAGDFKSTMAQVRSELNQTSKTQTATARSELSTRQQLSAAASLQRQRSAAMIAEWKRAERAAQSLATGVRPVSQNLQRITDVMQTLGASSATLTGPLGGISSRLRSLGSLATEAGGGVGIAGAAIGALAVAAVGASVAIYKLTVQTAEFQGKMFDLSQATGVSVETLSAFEILATTTGGSIESITASLGIFQKNLEDAQDPTSKEAKLLKDLGVETNNTEQALRQTLTALAAMPTGFQQTSRALELFGRGGKSILAILKEMDGDLDGAIQKFRAMGILIDTDTARAADKFNDQLAILQFQLRGVVALVGREAMPIILSAVQQVSRALVDNRQVISEWAKNIGDAGRGALILGGYLAKLGGIITGLGNIPIPMIIRILGSISGATGILSGLAQIGAASRPAVSPRQGRIDRFNQLADSAMASGAAPRIGGGGRGGGRSARDTSLQDATKDAALAEREAHQRIDADIEENKRAFEEQARTLEEFTDRAIDLADKRLNATIDRINAEWLALQAALSKKLISEKEYDQKKRELDLETNAAITKNADAVWEAEQKRDKTKAASEFAAHQRSAQIAEEASERLIQIIQDRIDNAEIAESEGERQIAELVAQGFERRKKLLEDELTRINTSYERKKEINDELIKLDGQRAYEAERAADRIEAARQRELPGRPRRVKDATRPRSVKEEEFGKDAEQLSTWEKLDDAMRGTEGVMKQFYDASQMYVVEGFKGMAAAATSAIEAWILYGGNLGKALKMALAAELASIAARATVQAALHGAYALGSLAFGDFSGAAKHGIAALKFLAVAALTGVAARGLAGSAGTAQAGAATQGSGFQSATRVGSGSTTQTTLDVNRRATAQPPIIQPVINVTVRGEVAGGFKYEVEKVIVESYREDGKVRDVLGHAQGQPGFRG